MLAATMAAGVVAPTSAPAQTAAVAADTGTTRFDVDGVKVIYRHTNTNLFVANLYLLGGVSIATPATAGLETMLLEAAQPARRQRA